ncbi:sugar ABC transporter substrate-binding protein [Metabacillus bambusae]|uniref:Sugar ABC transporter substrate-binding protein n=1 Tax=Metabacillus bambusae TaxID=2795218 RepID=A0ABS3NAU8_9BACI|nr:sugar ABC transporter substrate-binding protein [Metabacillus bambusae]MBO1515407.1 sugar ABC transporter substrate-binding protein [Metabacillus bambusae]
MLKKSKLLLLIVFVFSAIIIGFITKSFADEKPKVVVVLKDLNSQYWEIVNAGVNKGFQDFGMDGKVLAPRVGTVEEQNEILEQVLKEKPDVLVVSPIIPSETIPILEKFVKINIPVLLLDTDDPWAQKTTYVGTNNFELGEKAGSLLASHLQPGDEVALIGGDLTSPVSGDRMMGAKRTLEDAGIIVAGQVTELSNDSEPIRNAMTTILKNHPNIKGVMASNDVMALEVIDVIKEHGINMPVTGADGITEMLELIEEGTIPGTVAQNPYDMGYLSIENALKVSEGEKVEKNIDSGVDIIIKGNAEGRLEFLNKLLK